ncbi:MAG: hypothetical protein AB7O45_13340 [Alphaproteobacteria bacterium]
MRFVRFGSGVVVGLVLGAAVPLMAQGWPQLLGTVLTGRTYGVPSGASIIFGCADASGYLIQNSVATVETIPSVVAGIPFTLAGVACR